MARTDPQQGPGRKVNGKLQWMHVVNCAQLTLYGHHPKRGFAALEAVNVLQKVKGAPVHDAWSAYFRLPALHALCGAHLLHELHGLTEHHGQVWAGDLRDALLLVYHQRKEGRLTLEITGTFEERFGALLQAGLDVNPPVALVPRRRGRTKQSPGRNLVLRCTQHRKAVLRFLHDEGVPFDNNQAERDIRPWCVKRKVSGGFRSIEGSQNFARIRSYISTLRKQGLNKSFQVGCRSVLNSNRAE